MPPRIADDEYVDDGADAYDAEDFLDDDDSGDEYRSAPSLPKLGTLRGAASRSSAIGGASNGRAGTSAAGASSSNAAAAARAKAAANAKSKQKDQGYSWEATYKRSWDAVAEDDSGSLESAVRSMIEGSKRRRVLKDVAPVQRGIIRHLVLLIDLSASMLEKDMRPNRFDVTLQYAREFVGEYFDQNPIGQLSIIGTRQGIAERLAMMGGNTVDHTASLSNKRRLEPRGEPSLQNALEMARSSLVHLPASNSREILAIFGSLTTCDPGNIHDTIGTLVKDNIRVSIVHLAAEVKVFKDVCTRTGGTFSVALNEGHFHDSLFELVPPPAVEGPRRSKRRSGAATNGAAADGEDEEEVHNGVDLLQMAFPLRLPAHAAPTLCACHSRSRGSGYVCPRCGVKVCDVPTDCPVCGITIVMSTHLARSYHHLFPVPNWKAVPWTDVSATSDAACLSCNLPFPTLQDGEASSAAANKALEDAGLSASSRYRCTRCSRDFCLECDAFVHEQLHVCPGCC
ncbi:probable SSL1-TFIIH subunit (transcription initiation factor), factor B [Sporisorium reilianum f. sp. reilianum]|uniref:General transcription and DNA repair factor IIH n=1 Tax=Sporisorium reilianum f. sp. reilianum TaxID=72559 RepID=A0A2N8ULA3_9BASI|nr:probable SSL1-TFIIH subunit (transcription initiation factor), factor B [Sporisorium reilianum f. sp. reilianum]